MKCSKCKVGLDDYSAYEYRGALSCADCFDTVIECRDRERNQLIQAEDSKLNRTKGLDLSDSVIGRANREMMKGALEVSSKESYQMKEYEGRLNEKTIL